MQLQIESVLQAQRLELLLGQVTGEAAVDLAEELARTLGDKAMVEFVVTV